jgi:cobalt/nickel transport system ATP-binding protein
MKQIFTFDNICYHYPGYDHSFALNGFSLQIPQGEKIAVLGRNGSGKTTFFLHCNGLYRPASGEVFFRGQPLKYDRHSLRNLRQKVGLVFQNPDEQLFSASVTQDISYGPLNLGLSEEEVRRRVQQVSDDCDLSHLIDRPTHALSGGEKARVALAGVLAMKPDVLIADEPLNSLDPWVRLSIFEILDHFFNQGNTILMATHNLSVVRHWASYIILLENGRVEFTGTPQELITNQTILDQTGLSRIWKNLA